MIKVFTGNIIPQIKDGVYFPCGSMHPDDITPFAKEIVKYGTNLIINHNVKNIVIITYNPMLIEALDVWSEYYRVEDKIEFYLNNHPVPRYMGDRMMCHIYDNLGRGYDRIDDIKIDILYRCDDDECCC